MPLLDVSFMTRDPYLSTVFNLTRRLNAVGDDGRVAPTPDQFFQGLQGVVTQQDASMLMQAEDGQTYPKRIFIASTFQFVSAATGYTGDEILWRGVLYICTSSLPYPEFGEGVYEGIFEFRGNIPAAQ